MTDEYGIVQLTFGDSLSYGQLRLVTHTLTNGGLCILPSDTSYSLAALPSRRDALRNLAVIQPQTATDPILLAFGSLALVEQYARLTAKDYRLIDAYCPGPITLVCEISDKQRREIIEDMLHTVGTIGVRIPDSPVERQISIELQRPITTCAIRDDLDQPVRSFDDALAIVRSRMKRHGSEFMVFAIRKSRIAYQDLSTIASAQPEAVGRDSKSQAPYSIVVIRPGVLEPELLEDTIRKLSPSDLTDWT